MSGYGSALPSASLAYQNPITTDQAPLVPLFTPRLPDLTSKRVGDYEYQRGFVLLDQLWIH
jgi:hypothetical protein